MASYKYLETKHPPPFKSFTFLYEVVVELDFVDQMVLDLLWAYILQRSELKVDIEIYLPQIFMRHEN